MIKSITASVAMLSYAYSLFYLSIVKARTLHLIYRRMGIRSDDLLHLLSFVFLAFLIRVMLSTRLYRPVIQRPLIWSSCIAAIIAVVIEMLQIMISTRHATFLDLSCHWMGILIYFVVDRVACNILEIEAPDPNGRY